jgi:hypothetical protein
MLKQRDSLVIFLRNLKNFLIFLSKSTLDEEAETEPGTISVLEAVEFEAVAFKAGTFEAVGPKTVVEKEELSIGVSDFRRTFLTSKINIFHGQTRKL